jgi:hypothetical protein
VCSSDLIGKVSRKHIKASDLKDTTNQAVAQGTDTNRAGDVTKLTAGKNEVASMNHEVGTAWTKKTLSGAHSGTGAWHAVKTGTGVASAKHDSVAVSGTGTLNAAKIGNAYGVEKAKKLNYSSDYKATPQRIKILGR